MQYYKCVRHRIQPAAWGNCTCFTTNFLNPNEDFCAMVLPRLHKRSGPTCATTQSQPWTSTLYTEGEEIVANHGSASMREETPPVTETTQITISNALKRRAHAVINDTSIDPQWRNIVRYALEISDPLLPDLVRRADAALDELEKAFASVQAARSDVATKTTTQDNALSKLDQTLTQLAGHVESVAGKDDDTLITTAGMETRSSRSAPTVPTAPQGLSATAGDHEARSILCGNRSRTHAVM
jgi:hypothetical protein